MKRRLLFIILLIIVLAMILKYGVNAAPISPNELGRNRKYVFALPPRANYADLTGVEEVDDILRHGPLHPFWSK